MKKALNNIVVILLVAALFFGVIVLIQRSTPPAPGGETSAENSGSEENSGSGANSGSTGDDSAPPIISESGLNRIFRIYEGSEDYREIDLYTESFVMSVGEGGAYKIQPETSWICDAGTSDPIGFNYYIRASETPKKALTDYLSPIAATSGVQNFSYTTNEYSPRKNQDISELRAALRYVSGIEEQKNLVSQNAVRAILDEFFTGKLSFTLDVYAQWEVNGAFELISSIPFGVNLV